MKIIAMIQNGVVMNLAVWDGVSPWSPIGYTALVDVTAKAVNISYTYDGKNFTAPVASTTSTTVTVVGQ